MFRAVWPTESGSRSLIGVVLGQHGDNLVAAGLEAAEELVHRLAPNAALPETVGQPELATPAGAYRRHIENHIRAGNTPLP